VKRIVTEILLLPIRIYRRWVSPAFAPRCRYYPTCSAYCEQAIRELGPLRGTILAGYRLLRCNPFSAGGIDELEDRRLFRNTPTRSERRHHQRPPQTPRPHLPVVGGSSRPDAT
jgi:putative membrane protein insertion efficiency factor